jgi:hypothetical protein
MDEMAELLNEMPETLVSHWHDVGHAEAQHQLGFSLHETWLLRFQNRMAGIYLHYICGSSNHHAPRKGNINWETVAKYLSPGIVKPCEIDEWNDEDQIARCGQISSKQRNIKLTGKAE